MLKIIKFIVKIILLFYLIFLKEGFLDHQKLPPIFYTPVAISIIHFLIFFLSVNIIIRFAQMIYRKRKHQGDKYSDNVIIGLQNIYYLLMVMAVIVMIIGFFGIEFSKLLTAISIVAAAIAIISKEFVSDIIAGISLTFSKELSIGDYVKIGEYKGRVIDINLHKIVLHHDDDDIIYIPNSKAYYEEIINYTQKEIRKFNVDFSINSNLNIPLSSLQVMIHRILLKYNDAVVIDSEKLKVINILQNEIRYKLQFKLNQMNPELAEQIKSEIREGISLMIIRNSQAPIT